MTSVYQKSDSDPPQNPSQVHEKGQGGDHSLQEETLQQMKVLIKENMDMKDSLKQNSSSMKERLEELLAWKERQVLEKELLEGKLMEAMRHLEALTKINKEQQEAAVAEDSEVENLKVLMAKLKAEKTDLVAMNSELQLKLSQRFPEDFVAVQFAECTEINRAHDLLISQKDSTFCTVKHEERTVSRLLQSLRMETEKVEKLHHELQAVRNRMLELESWTHLKGKNETQNSGCMEDNDHCCRSNTSTNMDGQIQYGPSVTGDGSYTEVESLKVQTQTLVKDLHGLQSKLEDSEDMKKSLHDKCRDIEGERNQLRAQLVDKQQRYEKTVSQVKEMQQENKKLNEHMEEKKQENNKLRAQLAEKRQGNEKMESQIESKQWQCEKMELQLEKKQQENNKLKVQLEKTQLENKKMESQLEEKQLENKKLKVQLEEKWIENKKMESQLEENKKMESQLEEKQQENKKLKVQLAEKQQEKEKMESQLEEKQQENEMLKKQLDNMSSCMKTEQNNAEEGRRNFAQLKDAHDQLYEEYMGMQKQIRETKEEMNGLNDRLGAAEEALVTKQQKIDEMKQEIFKKEAELETISLFKAQAEVYSSDFYAEREAREKIHEEKERLAEELNNIRKENMQLQEQIECLGRQTVTKLQLRHGSVPCGAGPPGGNVSPG
ncbi:optineurin-like isoform X2 [Brienomyrus brachyistius]|uniref:optineurin-like isoform X2 n=1 Tax=Brienomyrus brachyistius TaxID=42636 RepID=UPI0020B32A0E|nr:optineurin-like isoform X2 [Brienomyrus brachyistius]